MSQERKYNEKTDELEQYINGELENLEQQREGLTRSKVSTPLLIGIGVPFAIFGILYFGKPRLVQAQKNGKWLRERSKLVRWTVVFTLVLYGAAYLYACYSVHKTSQQFSSKQVE